VLTIEWTSEGKKVSKDVKETIEDKLTEIVFTENDSDPWLCFKIKCGEELSIYGTPTITFEYFSGHSLNKVAEYPYGYDKAAKRLPPT
jgi:hypothetical protein